jgi:hypothetical protein
VYFNFSDAFIFKGVNLRIYWLLLIVILAHLSSAYAEEKGDAEYNQWLKSRFSAQHEKLIPIVAVADIFYGCNLERKTDEAKLTIKALITQLDKNQLAEKLATCLQGELANSDNALNFGLLSCFDEQLETLPEAERQLKKKLVLRAIASLSRAERQKSFTQCVTDQAIGYLK